VVIGEIVVFNWGICCTPQIQVVRTREIRSSLAHNHGWYGESASERASDEEEARSSAVPCFSFISRWRIESISSRIEGCITSVSLQPLHTKSAKTFILHTLTGLALANPT